MLSITTLAVIAIIVIVAFFVIVRLLRAAISTSLSLISLGIIILVIMGGAIMLDVKEMSSQQKIIVVSFDELQKNFFYDGEFHEITKKEVTTKSEFTKITAVMDSESDFVMVIDNIDVYFDRKALISGLINESYKIEPEPLSIKVLKALPKRVTDALRS